MSPGIVAGGKTAAGFDFPNLGQTSGANRDSGSHSVANALAANYTQHQPMVSRNSLIDQQRRSVIQLSHGDIHVSVIVKVGECGATAAFHNLQARTGQLAHIQEPRFPAVQVELVLLAILGLQAVAVHLRVDMTIGHIDVLESVIVEVKKTRPPTKIAKGVFRNSRCNGTVFEESVPLVQIQCIGVVGSW